MEEDKFKPSVQFMKSPEVKIQVDNHKAKEEVTTTLTFPVHALEDDLNDSFIKVRSSILKKIRDKIHPYTEKGFNFHDLLLSVSTTLLGIVIGALYSNLKLDTRLGIFTYIFLPVISAITGTAYFFLKKQNLKEVNDFAKELLNDIPNPNQTVKPK